MLLFIVSVAPWKTAAPPPSAALFPVRVTLVALMVPAAAPMPPPYGLLPPFLMVRLVRLTVTPAPLSATVGSDALAWPSRITVPLPTTLAFLVVKSVCPRYVPAATLIVSPLTKPGLL